MTDRYPDIVMTGAGLTTGLGRTREATWKAVLQGRCGAGPLSALECPLPPGRDGVQAVDLPADFAPDLPREARYLKWTLDEALRDAGVQSELPCPSVRFACVLGTTLHGMRAAGRFFRSGDFADLRQFLAGDTLALAAGNAPFAGFSATICSACSSSLGSIALGVTLLQSGEADLVVAGGYDTISEYVYAGFNSLRLVAEGPLQPFAKDRKGMKLGEGYGIVVLERAEDAARRGARPLAAILGWGESADAHHLTQPNPEGDGAARAMAQAIDRAGVSVSDISLIAAHATGTPDNDAAEYRAYSRVFGEKLPGIPVVAFKSHLGHALGGAGAVELILSATALRDQILPACVNVTRDQVEFADLNLICGESRPAPLGATLNVSLGFGGANTCIVLGKPPAPSSAPRNSATARTHDVLITGIGVILPGIVGNDALRERLTSDAQPAWMGEASGVPEDALEGLLSARRVRRMSDYVKLTLAATTLAFRDAGIQDIPAFASDCAAVLGTTHGSSNYSLNYYRQIVSEGLLAANPMLFAEGVPNAAAAHLSLMLSLKEACQTVIGTRTAGLDAIALASARIRTGVWRRAIVSAAEEHCTVVNGAYLHCGAAGTRGAAPFGDETGFVSSAGAITFILESHDAVASRGGKVLGRIDRFAARRGLPAEAVQSIGQILEMLGEPEHVMSSACSTWIDRAEAATIRNSSAVRTVSAIYGHIAETFSVSPLVAAAAVLLSGKLPRLLGEAWTTRGSARAATGNASVDHFAAIGTDFAGSASGIRFGVGQHRDCLDVAPRHK